MDRSQFRKGIVNLWLESNEKLVKYFKQERVTIVATRSRRYWMDKTEGRENS